MPRVPTDQNEARRLTLAEADAARAQGITMYAIGIGPEITPQVLNGIANQPSSQYTFQVDQFNELGNILSTVTSAACAPSPVPPPVPVPVPSQSKCLRGMCEGRNLNLCKVEFRHCQLKV